MAELHASKKTIAEFFSKMQNKKFIIPDYQRPYEWNIEQCETLWNDIEYFAHNREENGYYFLGSIVSFSNKDRMNYPEIIDGQQRITSLMLLLRAFYKKLEGMKENKKVIILKSNLAPCIWDINEDTDEVEDFTKIHISSEVATENDNSIFHKILAIGEADEDGKDRYSQNYLFFQKKCDDYATTETLSWEKFCSIILDKCIILPIECDDQDTALTIFSTLNNRGLPLSDADIFKAQFYKNNKKRQEFTQIWKDLTDICKKANINIDDIFRYYMHVIRARDSNKGREIGLRTFYQDQSWKNLNKVSLSEIIILANFWKFVYLGYKDDTGNQISEKSKQWINCLWYYPNEYWKYTISVFFLKNKDNDDFQEQFEIMLERLVAFLFAKFIDRPTVNAIKDDIFNAYVDFEKNINHQYNCNIDLDSEIFSQKITEHSQSRITRALLLLHAYLHPNQTTLIDDKFDIEHIFPTKWQDTNYNGWNKNDADKYLNNLGNKIVFEKKLNIQAGNEYFGKKKTEYQKSAIATVQDLISHANNDWLKEDIIDREKTIKNDLITFFKSQLKKV